MDRVGSRQPENVELESKKVMRTLVENVPEETTLKKKRMSFNEEGRAWNKSRVRRVDDACEEE